MKLGGLSIAAALLCVTAAARAETLTVEMKAIDPSGIGEPIGVVILKDIRWGLLIQPDLKGLEPGIHGFHVHENPSCRAGQSNSELAAGVAAGGHFDPNHSNAHNGPYAVFGHLGDLPGLVVNADGASTYPLLAPRLNIRALHGHALMIDEGGDNYSDKPDPLGGGGAHIACGIIE